jgi:hypothetical protein
VCACAGVLVLARPCKGVRRAATRRHNIWRVVGRAVMGAMTAVQVWAGSIAMTLALAFALAGWLGDRVGAELGRKEKQREAQWSSSGYRLTQDGRGVPGLEH